MEKKKSLLNDRSCDLLSRAALCLHKLRAGCLSTRSMCSKRSICSAFCGAHRSRSLFELSMVVGPGDERLIDLYISWSRCVRMNCFLWRLGTVHGPIVHWFMLWYSLGGLCSGLCVPESGQSTIPRTWRKVAWPRSPIHDRVLFAHCDAYGWASPDLAAHLRHREAGTRRCQRDVHMHAQRLIDQSSILYGRSRVHSYTSMYSYYMRCTAGRRALHYIIHVYMYI